MNLADMLCYADIAELTRIAETYDCSCSGHSKNELIQSILSKVQRRDVLETRVGEITVNDLRFLNSLLFETRTAYSLEELKARALGSDPAVLRKQVVAAVSESKRPPEQPGASNSPPKGGRSRKAKKAQEVPPMGPEEIARHAITRFKRFGWLFSGFSQQTRYLYQVPEDVKSRLCDALERRFRASVVYTGEPSVYRDERSLISDDLLKFIRFVRGNDIPLTSEGVMYKRQIGQIMELFSVNETIPARGGWRFGYGRRFRDYPERFSLIYDFAYYQSFINEQRDRLTLTEQGLAIADGAERIDPAKIYSFWLRLYKGPIPNLSTLVQWVMRLSSDWVTVESLVSILQPLVRSYYYDTGQDILERRVFAMMMHLGLVRWGETVEGQSVIRITPQGKSLISGNSLAFEDKLVMD